MKLHITSETGRLQGVIVHTPGPEISLVDPETKDELLFDDIIFEEDARREHLDMLELFRTVMPDDAPILELTDLARETMQDADIRRSFAEQLSQELYFENLHPVLEDLKQLDADHLLRFTIEGRIHERGRFRLHPTPNLIFTRDLAAVVGDHIILPNAAKRARVREFLLMELIARHHPLFASVREKTISIPKGQSLEGGDVLVVSEKVVLVGMSERTTFSGLIHVAEQLFATGVERVLAVDIPKKRSSMHLDTIFTFADDDECVVFPQAITETEHNVVEIYSSGNNGVQVQTHVSLKQALEQVLGKPLHFIRCGGERHTDQLREQWTDGANLFCLAPGVVVGYERNTKTFEELDKHGYRVMDQQSFLGEFQGVDDAGRKRFDPEKEGKVAIMFEGHELCRGRGGARCMTLPVLRS
jgi:arginine deiminase